MTTPRKKLIEVALPLEVINRESAREKSIRHGHPSTLHLWWARRPLAACRAVLFAQLVDDPSAWPDRFPTEADRDRERQRLFALIEEMVPWEASNDARVLAKVRAEIARSFARGRLADGEGDHRDHAVLADDVKPEVVLAYLADVVPPVHDPFAGGGSIPLEAQRLGLRAIATDLNPVAVLINKALIEIPPKFAGRAPVGPLPKGEKQESIKKHWPGATGLAEDVRRYGAWMREEAWKRVGHLYPEVELPPEHGGGKATVIAWLWARTVESPNPAFRGVHVPLVASFWLAKKPGKETWVEPVVEGRQWRFVVREAIPSDPEAVSAGTKLGRGANFRCVMSGVPIEPDYIKAEGRAGRMGQRLMAIVAEGDRRRTYLSPPDECLPTRGAPDHPWSPDAELPSNPRWFSPPDYGMPTYGDLFTRRQLCVLSTLADMVQEVRDQVRNCAADAWNAGEASRLEAAGLGPSAYADGIATYLAAVIDKLTESSSTICTWSSAPKNELVVSTFRRQALPMTWDFAEANPFAKSSGSIETTTKAVYEVIAGLPAGIPGRAEQMDASSPPRDGARVRAVVSTDPPYYDNIGYADLSDYFYVWLRHTLRPIYPALFDTVLAPKADELVATPYRHGGVDNAEAFFLQGMSRALAGIAGASPQDVPVAVYYAFKQSETEDAGTSSTGWETFLTAVLRAGLIIDGTWPVRTERAGRTIGIGTNALASSVILVCRRRPVDAPTVTRGKFRQLLRAELPAALRALEKGNIAPVDMAQASIGPGMAIFSRHSRVLEADDKPMSVRTALQLIHEVVDELRGEEEAELDRETRFAVTWFETRGFSEGPYGEAEVLATARAVSVEGVKDAGLVKSAAGKVRLLKREELPSDWDPAKDTHPTVWEATQHLIKRLDEAGEDAAAALLAKLGSVADDARLLTYRLYTVCERKGWADEGRAYNGLVIAWPELEKLAARGAGATQAPPAQQKLGLKNRDADTTVGDA